MEKTPTTYRWMTHHDIPELATLATRIWNAHYPGIITQAQIDYMLAKSYAHDAVAKQLARGQRFLLAMDGTSIIGFLSTHLLEHIAEPLLRGENVTAHDFYLHKFYVANEQQGKGIGRALLAELLKQMPEIQRLRLQVARKNRHAWEFIAPKDFALFAKQISTLAMVF